MHIRCRTLQTYDIACIYKHTISYTLWIHCVVRYRMSYIRHRMLTYDIVKTYDIVHTISYVQQCNIVYTISYIRYGIRHPTQDIRYRMSRHTISYVTYDIVCGKNPDERMRIEKLHLDRAMSASSAREQHTRASSLAKMSAEDRILCSYIDRLGTDGDLLTRTDGDPRPMPARGTTITAR